jgi:ribosome assembly protein 1
MNTLCKKAFLNAEPRLAEGTYLCQLLITPDKIGVVYELIAKYRGQVLQEDIQDGTNYFMLDLMVPLVSSFGFIDSIRRACQGIAYP